MENGFIVVCDDYHDFDLIVDSIQGIKLKHHEVGATIAIGYLQYVAIIYKGRRPKANRVAELLQDAKITLTED